MIIGFYDFSKIFSYGVFKNDAGHVNIVFDLKCIGITE
jgi:hypothetical protein